MTRPQVGDFEVAIRDDNMVFVGNNVMGEKDCKSYYNKDPKQIHRSITDVFFNRHNSLNIEDFEW